MTTPLVESLDVDGPRLTVRAGAAFRRRWLTEDFWTEYEPGIDLAAVPPEIQLVPFVFNVAPVVWASGEHYEVDSLDERTVESLATVRDVLRRLYPEIEWSGELSAARVEPAPSAPAPSALEEAMLFSGGLDSTYTALSRGAERQLLVTIWGNDIVHTNERGWAAVRRDTEAFARTFGHHATFVRGNFRAFLNLYRLNGVVESIPSWWGNVAHGLGLIGMTAPILQAAGIERLVIAATRNEDYQAAWGSHPDLDTNARWATVAVEHHGYDTSRQQKLGFIAEHARGTGARPKLRVCYSDIFGAGTNCCHCEKCLRTATGLVLEGQRPREYGFAATQAEVASRVLEGFAERRLTLKEGQAVMWQELQRRALEVRARGLAGPDLFLDWLAVQDFHAYRRNVRRRELLRKRASRVKANALARAPVLQPGVEAAIRRVRKLS
jgi:hypothetical protein